jgi:hypothetical protein
VRERERERVCFYGRTYCFREHVEGYDDSDKIGIRYRLERGGKRERKRE